MALVPIQDLWVPMSLTILSVAVIWVVIGLLFWAFYRFKGNSKAIERSAIAVSWATTTFFVFGQLRGPLYNAQLIPSTDISPNFMLSAWIVLAVPTAIALSWKSKLNSYITKFFNIASLFLVLAVGCTLISGWWGIRQSLSNLDQQTSQNISSSTVSKPDVFYIILDGYGRADQLKRIFSYDNSQFVNALTSRGFYVADRAHSNYCQTELSLASTLNMEFVQSSKVGSNPDETSRAGLDYLIDQSKAASTFRKYGYRYIAVPTGFPSLQFSSADLIYQYSQGATLFESSYLSFLPIPPPPKFKESQFEDRRLTLLSAFEHLKELAKPAAAPRFVVAHILMPHPPFVFGPKGEPIRAAKIFGYWDGSHYMEFVGDEASYSAGYIGQLQYLNTKIIEVVDRIKKASNGKAVILIQGDHGSKVRLDQESLAKTDPFECFSNLSAYLVPVSVESKLYPSITPVNSFRVVLNGLFGSQLPLLKDQSWYSSWSKPFQFEDVTAVLKNK